MNVLLKQTVMLKGYKPLCYINSQSVLVFRKLKFYLYNIKDKKLQFICKVNLDWLMDILCHIRFTQRIFRLEPRTAISVNDKEIMVSLSGGLFLISLKDKSIIKIHKFTNGMSNVLSFCKIENIKSADHGIYYGEYFTNMDKKAVSIFWYDRVSENFKNVYTFKKGSINHIHQIIEDSFRDRVWIFTGDFGNAAAIWYTDNNFNTVNYFLGGAQKYRACVTFPVADGLIYATDTPLNQNYIMKIVICNEGIKEVKIGQVNGSCIYGTKYGDDWFIWSSSVEPKSDDKSGILSLISYKRADGIKTWYSYIVGYNNITNEIKIFDKCKKDIFPMGLCQFGTMMFPCGEAPQNQIIFYGSALKKIDGNTYIVTI